MLACSVRGRFSSYLNWWIIVASVTSCRFDDAGTNQSDTSGGQGNLGGQVVQVGGNGGELATGGTNALGGSTVATGGVTVAVTTGQAGSAAQNTLPDICQSDRECPASARRCLSGTCVACLGNGDCPSGTICEGTSCSNRRACTADAECVDKYRCDSTRGFCVRCLSDVDCPASQSCTESRCEPYISCVSSVDCPANSVCNPSSLKCVQCNANADCVGDAKICQSGICQAACTSDSNCAAPTPKCDLATGACAACVTHADCRSDEFCNFGKCILDRCTANESRCAVGGVESCNADGDGFGAAVACPSDRICAAQLSHASCGASISTGGTAGAGGSSGSSGMTSSAGTTLTAGTAGVAGRVTSRGGAAGAGGRNQGGASGSNATGGKATGGSSVGIAGTANDGGAAGAFGTAGAVGVAGAAGNGPIECAVGAEPCTSIPQFVGMQVVDGNGNEFCNIPSFEMSFASAAKVIEYKGQYGRTRYPERLVARVAWSAEYVHAFIRVTDPYVYPAGSLDYIWGADSIEFMISADRNLSGSTADDPSALHIIAAPWKTSTRGMAASVHTQGTSGTHTELPLLQYYVSVDTTGYSVELMVPWPDNLVVNAQSRIYFDLAINAAVAGLGDDPNVRDAQAIYYTGTVSGSSPCGSDVSAYCDDRSWCTTALD